MLLEWRKGKAAEEGLEENRVIAGYKICMLTKNLVNH
jgi:hypothetical protein